ncbi:hypothetical protein F5883DRAFT_531005 [Diaporthe sp. PMI_573]|nr:hypothetical protein F5883DRAFT_531005 [Diaporthaceae sp. PMI_573]
MWKIRYQGCGDIRDKVYGTLSMVRWLDDEAISVDYDRDTFDLAIQVMATIRKQPGAWDGRWYDAAANVARNLRLGTQPSAKLAAQIRKRRFDVSSPVGIIMGSRSPQESPFAGEPQQHDTYWGYRLVKTGNQWAFEGISAPLPGLAEGRTARIRSWSADSRPRIGDEVPQDSKLDDVLLPPTAQPGDWCLLHSRGRPVFQLDSQLTAINHHLRIDRVVLIAREGCRDPGYPLSVIGKGLIHSGMAFTPLEQPIATEFKVHLADEDALVLAATSRMIGGYGHGRMVEPAGINVWVSENEASCYFNTSVCASLYSSYALKLRQRSDGD